MWGTQTKYQLFYSTEFQKTLVKTSPTVSQNAECSQSGYQSVTSHRTRISVYLHLLNASQGRPRTWLGYFHFALVPIDYHSIKNPCSIFQIVFRGKVQECWSVVPVGVLSVRINVTLKVFYSLNSVLYSLNSQSVVLSILSKCYISSILSNWCINSILSKCWSVFKFSMLSKCGSQQTSSAKALNAA